MSEELESQFGLIAERKSSSTSDGFIGVDVGSQLGSVSLVSISLSSSTANAGTSAHDTSVDSTRDAVILLDVDLGQVEELLTVGGVLLNVSPGGAIDNLSSLETLDGFILGHASAAKNAPHDVGVALVLLSSSVVSSL